MNNLVRSLAAFALVLAACLSQPAFALDSGDIVVESIKGEVRVTMKGVAAAVRAGGVLELPATIDTGRNGALELRQGATTISVGPETRLEFPALEQPGGPIDRVVQPRGNAFYNIGKRAGRRLRVETPYLVGVIKGTQFNVAAQEDATTISLFEGLLEVHASDESSRVDLKAGEIAARKRGDKSISVIQMDNKAPPTQRAPGNPGGSASGTPAPGSSGPAPVVGSELMFADRSENIGTPAASRAVVDVVRTPADVNVETSGSESGVSIAAGTNLNVASINVDVVADVVASKGVDVGAGAAVELGSTGVDIATGVNLNSSGVDATVSAGVSLGGAVDAGVDAAVNVGGGAVDVGASINVDAGPAAVDVGAATNVDLGAGAVDVATNVAVDAGPLTTEVNAGAAIEVVPGNIGATVDLGTNVDLGNVAAVDNDVGATVNVGTNVDVAANVDVGTNVAGVDTSVNASVDVAAGNVDLGVSVAGIDLNVGVDLGLGNDSTTDTSTPTTTPATPVVDVGGLLDGLLRRPEEVIRIHRRNSWWMIVLATFAVVSGLHVAGALRPLENFLSDVRARMLRSEVPSDIVIVAIDARSIAALDQWPWPRRTHAELINRVSNAAPRRMFIDIDFSSSSNQLDDALLESALARPRDFPIVLPAFFQHRSSDDDTLVVRRPRARFARRVELAAVNAQPALDSLTREWRNYWTLDGQRVPSVIDPRRLLGDDQPVSIDFSISPESFVHVSYVDVLEGRVPREVLAGKTVFVGGTALELRDMLAVPVYGSLSGVELQALATETVNRGAPRSLPAWAALGILAAWTALVALLFSGKRSGSWRRNLAIVSVALAAVAGSAFYAFAASRLVLEAAAPMLAIVLLFGAVTIRSLDLQTWRALAYGLGMRRRDALLKSVVQSSTDAIVCIDEVGVVKTANPAASRLFNCAVYELVDEPIAKFITLLAGDNSGARLDALHGVIRECDARTHTGEVFPVEISVSRVRLNSERLYTAIVRDIRERRAQQRRLQHQATHDSLTGLPNRAALITHLDAALAAQLATPSIALLMLDLCRFKEVNDTLGHNIGDRVLCEVAQRFSQTLNECGFIARIGGDEFTVVLEQARDAADIAHAAQALTDCLRKPIDVAGISIEIGVSIGIARYPDDAADAQTLLRQADVAMYAAKRRGTSHEYYDPAYDENTVRKLAIGGELRSAIELGQLELHFQPQVNLRSGMVESAEALVRWFHPTQGAISPAEFVAIAESTDLIRPLTEWTLRGALTQIRAWREQGVHVRIAVNLSARLLQDTGFPARLRQLLETYAVSAASLELEITESAMMLDPARALRVIQEIDKLGVLISIDDFGTGYSSLGYLRDLPVHSLKLDKSFVMGMRNNTDDRIIVESTAQMANALRLELVAEGVETEWDARFLAAAGYDYAQGFHYSRALPADKCLAWIVEYNATAMLTAGDTTVTTALYARAEEPEEGRRKSVSGGT